MPKRNIQDAYEALPLSPMSIAKACCSYRTHPKAGYERLRKRLTAEQIEQFVEWFDLQCRRAYVNANRWFCDCLEAGDAGVEMLHVQAATRLEKFLDTLASTKVISKS